MLQIWGNVCTPTQISPALQKHPPSRYWGCVPNPLSTDYSGNKDVAFEVTPLAQWCW